MPTLTVASAAEVLLTSELDLQARTTAEDLARYLDTIENAVDAFFISPERRTRRELTIQLALISQGNEVRIVSEPDLSADAEEDLRKRLESVPCQKSAVP